MQKQRFYSLIVWIVALILIGSIIGSLTKYSLGNWYIYLNKSPLTPPNFVFGIAWSILYALIGICGWIIWNERKSSYTNSLKQLFIIQLLLNWSWTPIFFTYKNISLGLICIISLAILVATIMMLAYKKLKSVSLLMLPYFVWLVFATYLNSYIWVNN